MGPSVPPLPLPSYIPCGAEVNTATITTKATACVPLPRTCEVSVRLLLRACSGRPRTCLHERLPTQSFAWVIEIVPPAVEGAAFAAARAAHVMGVGDDSK